MIWHWLAREVAEHHAHRRGFAGARGADQQDHAAGIPKQRLIGLKVVALQPDGVAGEELRGLVEQAQHDLLAVHRRHRGDAQVDLAALHAQHGVAVLRDLALGNVHAAHDLQAGNDGALQLGWHGQNAAEQAVDAHAHHHLALLRLEVDIARALGKGALDEGVDKADGRRALAAVAVFRELRGHDIRPGGACLALHLFNDAGGALAAVEAADGLLGRAVRGDHRDHALARGGLDLLLRDEVQRIAHREVEGVAHQLHRHHAVFLRQRARHIFRQLHRNGASMSCCSVMMPLCTSTSPRRSLLSFCSSSARSSCSCEITPEDSSRSPKRIYAIGIHLRINKWGRRRGPAAKKNRLTAGNGAASLSCEPFSRVFI